MLQRLGIRGKILAVVAVPIIVLLLAAGYITLQATNALGDATNAQQLVQNAKASQPFQAAFNAERDAATNFVDTFASGTSSRAEAQDAVQLGMSQLQPRDAAAYAKVNDVFDGGQEIPGGTASSLDDVRAVGPSAVTADVDDWYVWPSAGDVTTATDSLSAMADAVNTLAGKESDATKSILQSIADALEDEAVATNDFLTVPQTYQAVYIESMPASDSAWASLLAQMRKLPSNDANESVIAMISTAIDQMRDLDGTRDGVRQVSNSADNFSDWYEGVTESVNEMISRSAIAVGDPDLSLEITAYAAIDDLFQQLSLESTLNPGIIRAGVYGPGDDTAARNQIAATDFALDSAQSATSTLPGGISVPDFGASTTTDSDLNFQSVRNAVATGDPEQLVKVADADWTGMVDTEKTAQQPAYDETIALATDRADELQQASLTQTVVTAALAIAALILTVVVALLIARRIVVPLRRLTTTATAVRAELPRLVERVAMPGETVDVAEVQIPVESRDEIGRLAEAFNGVNAATLSIASEQAALRGSISEMFVNVARRDQVLLNRQLASIDDMERTQDDPETLTKLFALDHLATRMRRNSESLLVLAGIDTGRRLRRAMPLSDVIRTASSEIELYERVQLELDADPAMLGHSALTAAHLFAELLENATVFSDPGTSVVVRTDERDGLFIVEIQDSGIGMTESELAEANSRVASTAASEILGAQRLGLFVVGRIARRIGARVTIASIEGAGTTATVIMTPSLFDSTVTPDVIHHTESTVDESVHAPAALVTHNVDDEQFEVAAQQQPGLTAYQPTMAEGASLAAREREQEPSVDDLIAADAAEAPSGVAVSGEELTDGVSATGLPTRRRRDTAIEVSEEEQKKIIGLPARATAAQLSALESANPEEEFKPAVPAAEAAPQTPEERAQMFRGFRSRRELGDAAAGLDPEAESLGHAARRGGVAPEDIAALNADVPEAPAAPGFVDDDGLGGPELVAAAGVGAMIIPMLEPDEDDEPVSAAEELVDEPAAMVVPPLEEDETLAPVADAPVAEADPAGMPVAAAEPVLEEDVAAVAEAEPTLEPDPQPAVVDVAEPEFEFEVPEAPVAAATAPAPAAPFGYADVYGSLPSGPSEPQPEPQQAWGAESVALGAAAAAAAAAAVANPSHSEPTLDELIAGATDEEAVKSGFFSRLFGRGKKPKATPEAVAPEAPAAPVAAAPVYTAPTFEPGPAAVEAPVAQAAPEPVFEAPVAVVAPEPVFEAPAYEAVAPVAPVAPLAPAAPVEPVAPVDAAASATPSPGGAFALWTSQPATPAAAPEAVEAPSAPAAGATFGTPVAGQAFTPDELANPFGWEAAGANALAAAEPEGATEYQPVVDIHPEAYGADETDKAELTNAAFSEFSSLTTERPKVETTRAGLTRRRASGEAAPEVKPIETEVQLAHKDRDADEVRNRFTSFYSGTQRARHDVAEFEQRSQSTAGKE